MNVKQKIIQLVFVLGIALSAVAAAPVAVGAACTPDPSKGVLCCAGVATSIIQCDQKGGNTSKASESGVWGLLLLALNIMTAGVGIAAVGGIVYGAILYTTASMNAEQVQKAKDVIRNVVIGIVAYAFMYLGLNFLVPGGIFT